MVWSAFNLDVQQETFRHIFIQSFLTYHIDILKNVSFLLYVLIQPIHADIVKVLLMVRDNNGLTFIRMWRSLATTHPASYLPRVG